MTTVLSVLVFIATFVVSAWAWPRWRAERRRRDAEFVRQALEFARERGGLPCCECVCAGMAGWCTHREPLPLPKATVVRR